MNKLHLGELKVILLLEIRLWGQVTPLLIDLEGLSQREVSLGEDVLDEEEIFRCGVDGVRGERFDAEGGIVFFVFLSSKHMSELVPAYLHLPYRQVHLVPDVVETHLLVEPYLPSSETIIVFFTIYHVVLFFSCEEDFP